MKIKISTILKNIYGEPLKSPRKKPQSKGSEKPEENLDLTLREIMVNSLLSEFQDEKGLSGEDKLKRYRLAMNIQDAMVEIDLDSKQVVEIKGLIAKGWSSLVSGQAWELIEP